MKKEISWCKSVEGLAYMVTEEEKET